MSHLSLEDYPLSFYNQVFDLMLKHFPDFVNPKDRNEFIKIYQDGGLAFKITSHVDDYWVAWFVIPDNSYPHLMKYDGNSVDAKAVPPVIEYFNKDLKLLADRYYNLKTFL